MGLLLLLILSLFFGYIFTEQKNRRCELLQSQLDEAHKTLERTLEQHQFEKRIWKNTVKELLNEV